MKLEEETACGSFDKFCDAGIDTEFWSVAENVLTFISYWSVFACVQEDAYMKND